MTGANPERGEALGRLLNMVIEGGKFVSKSTRQIVPAYEVQRDILTALSAPTETTQAASRNAGEGERDRVLLEGLAARLKRTALSASDAQAYLQYQEAEAIARVLAARHASVEAGEPVAWLLTHPTEPTDVELASSREPITDADRRAGWDAEPLYRRPLQAEAPMGEQS